MKREPNQAHGKGILGLVKGRRVINGCTLLVEGPIVGNLTNFLNHEILERPKVSIKIQQRQLVRTFNRERR